MRKIKSESIKVEDWIILIRKKKNEDNNYLIKVVGVDIQLKNYVAKSIKWWILKNKSIEKIDNIELKNFNEIDNPCNLSKSEFNNYDIYRLDKKEISIVKRKFILMKLG